MAVGSLELSIGAEGIADESLRTEGSIGGGPSTAISQSIPQSVAAPNKSSIAPTQVETSDLVVNLPSNTSLPEGEVPQDGCSGSIVDTGTTTTTTTAVIGQPLSNTPVSNTPPPPLTKKNPDKTASTTYLDEELREASDEEVLSSPVDQHNFAADMSPRTPPSTLLTTVVEGDEVSRQDLAAVAAGAALRSMFGGTQPLDNNTLINSARRPWYVSTESILSLAQEDEYYQPCSTATASTAPKRMMRPSPSSSGLLTRNDLSSASLLGNWRKLPSVPSNNVLNNQPTAASAEDWLHHVPSAPSLLQQQAMAGSNNSLATLEQLLNAENGGENDNKGGSTVLNIDTTDAVNAITVCIDGKVTKAQIRFGDTPLTLPTLIEAARLTNNNNNRETSSVLVQLLGGSSNAPTEYTLLDQLMAALRPEAAKLNNRLRRGHSKFGGSVPNLVGLLTAAANNRTEDNNLIRPK